MASKEFLDESSRKVIGASIEAHRRIGPGSLESVYVECLAAEMAEQGFSFKREIETPIRYKGREIAKHLRLDLLVENSLIVEAKSVDMRLPVHSAQLLTYLRMTGTRLGLLLNFNVDVMRQGIKRIVNGFNLGALCSFAPLR